MAIEHARVAIQGYTLVITQGKGFTWVLDKFVRGAGHKREEFRSYQEAADKLVYETNLIVQSLNPED